MVGARIASVLIRALRKLGELYAWANAHVAQESDIEAEKEQGQEARVRSIGMERATSWMSQCVEDGL